MGAENQNNKGSYTKKDGTGKRIGNGGVSVNPTIAPKPSPPPKQPKKSK